VTLPPRFRFSSPLTPLLIVFTTGLITIFVLKEFLLQWYLPGTVILLSDIIDVVILTPFSVVIFFLIYMNVSERGTPKPFYEKYETPLKVLILLSLAFYFVGIGIHFAGNSIHQLQKEEGAETGDIHELTYFYDEILGHIILFSGLFGLILSTAIIQYYHPESEQIDRSEGLLLGLAGLLFGLGLGWSLVEGQFGAVGILFFLVFAGRVCMVFKKHEHMIQHYPVILYLMAGVVGCVIGVPLWLSFGI